ncbi:flagellar hook-associated protein FlgK [Neopusillimonas aromaticivorans]|uniref:flagellar hook-associated protein FlgK n=1 Tax=Neopusillimonas aromaticivorans TaxID=2979868 RepID=UPI0025967582|nr:flagellar hook-associated protein FlgK [Neopusillimonas aromaticivorans]WJJ93188.1 flagellar hook-associated protein FlgK [Neopusillimonas aromaticivorans]
MKLANLGLAAINVAQNRMQTAGHNINNVYTDGYNRQQVKVSTEGAQNMGRGYIGMGARVDSIERSYDNFLYRQVVNAKSKQAELASFGTEITQINNLFADRTAGVSPALQKFFDGIQAVASSPADPAARKELVGRASSLVGQLNDANAFLEEQRGNINTQISTVVRQVNSYVERIHDFNNQIVRARASGSGATPNDLLDQRDQAVAELNELVGVKVIEQGDRIGLTFGAGQVLLSGDTVYPLSAQPSDYDPRRTAVAYSLPAGNNSSVQIELDDKYITGGKLGGLLSYRTDSLDAVQNDLGRLAVGLAMSINKAQANGEDLNGDTGADMFSIANPTVLASPRNNPASTGNVTVQFADANKLTGANYQVSFDGTAYKVVRLPEQTVVAPDDPVNAPGQYDGLTFNFPNSADVNAGDSWSVAPTRMAASDLSMAMTDPAKFAAAGPGTGVSDNANALEMAKLQTAKTLGNGAMNFNEAYSQIVNNVGVQTQQIQTAQKAQAALVQQTYAAQQAYSGVNLNEEYVNLQRYQEQFQAASRLINVSSTLFDTLLSLKQ